jgi:hypothetical protein
MYQQMKKIPWLIFIFILCACTLHKAGDGTKAPDGSAVEKGEVWVDFDSTQILLKESFPMQVEIIVSGDLPPPSHELRWEVEDADASKAIYVTIYSEINTGETCAQLLEPFTQAIPLGDFEDTGYSIWVNDYQVGGF